MALPPLSKLPSPQILEKSANVEAWDEDEKKVLFGSIYEKDKTIVVFIRHFFCGLCHQYTAKLAVIQLDALQAAKKKIAVVGCGEWNLMRAYKDTEVPSLLGESRRYSLGLIAHQ